MLSALFLDIKTFGLLLIISIVLIFIDSLGLLKVPKIYLQTVTSPIQFGLYKTSSGFLKQFEFIVMARKAAQENKALTEQTAQILSENANLRRKLAEAEGFLTQKDSLNPQTFNMVPARPLGISRYLLLDRGFEDGVQKDQVVVYKDSYIGKIQEISPKKSKVLLVSDPDSGLAAFISSNAGKAKGVLKGQFGSEMLLDKILHQEPVEKGDLVYSEGSELEIPRGLILGQVTEIIKQDNEVFKQAKVKPLFDVTNLEILFIITN